MWEYMYSCLVIVQSTCTCISRGGGGGWEEEKERGGGGRGRGREGEREGGRKRECNGHCRSMRYNIHVHVGLVGEHSTNYLSVCVRYGG